MKSFVLDCSVTMAWCFDDEANETSDYVLSLLKNHKALVPTIWSLEVMNVLRVGERKNRITSSQSNTFMNLLNALPIEIEVSGSELFNPKVMDISRKYSISSYDAAYLELASRKSLPLFSFDQDLCNIAKKSGVEINKFQLDEK